MLGAILLATFVASAVSLFLVGILLLSKKFIHKISFLLVSFAAGALLATGFLDTLPQAVLLGGKNVFLWVVISIAFFFTVERLFFAMHHHEEEDDGKILMPTAILLFGDSLHNFIDGVAVAAAFLADFRLGIITTLAVFIHEIPHELGDFGILINKGWSRIAVFNFNALTALAAFLGAIIAFYVGSTFGGLLPILLAVAAGNFIYISAADLLPEIHHKAKRSLAWRFTSFFFLGIFLIAFLVKFVGE